MALWQRLIVPQRREEAMTEPRKIERDRQRLMNPVTLERLAANASDLSRTHGLINVFHVFAEASVVALSRDLEGAGFSIEDGGEPLLHGGSRYWKVEARVDMVPVLAALNLMTDSCVDIAVRNSVDYDGWYTEVVTRGELSDGEAGQGS